MFGQWRRRPLNLLRPLYPQNRPLTCLSFLNDCFTGFRPQSPSRSSHTTCRVMPHKAAIQGQSFATEPVLARDDGYDGY